MSINRQFEVVTWSALEQRWIVLPGLYSETALVEMTARGWTYRHYVVETPDPAAERARELCAMARAVEVAMLSTADRIRLRRELQTRAKAAGIKLSLTEAR